MGLRTTAMKKAWSGPQKVTVPRRWALASTATVSLLRSPSEAENNFNDKAKERASTFRICWALYPCTNHKFGFSLANVEMNGACPIGNIKSQIGKYCALYCGCSGLEVGIRITGTLLGMKLDNEGPMICMDSFFREIKLKLNLPKNFDFKGPRPQDLGLDIFTYLDILSSKGVRNRMKSGTAWPKTCKISSYKTVSNNFEKICEVLARGIPLFAAIRTGKSFIDLKPNEIYVPPREDQITKGKSHGKHAILLFGAGMTPEGTPGIKGPMKHVFSDRMVEKAMRFCGSVSEIVDEAAVQDVERKSLFCIVHLEFRSALPLLMGDLLVLESLDGLCLWEGCVVGFGDSMFLVGDTEHVIVHVHDGQDIPLKMLPPFKCIFVEPSSTSIPIDNSGEAAFGKANKAPLDEAENRAKAKIKIGINGYGSFGRAAAKIALNSQDVELVAINEPKVMMDEMTCLFRDSQWLRSDFKMKDHNTLMFGEKEVTLFRIEEGNDIPWNMTGAEYIVVAYTDESGYDYYKDRTSKYNHYSSNANVFGNHLSPLAKILHDRFGTVKDVSVDCWVAVLKIKPQNKHAATAIKEVLPQWKGMHCGFIFKVPAVDITIELDQYMDHGLLLSSIKPSFGFSTLLGWCVEMARQLPEVRYCELKFK
ncbi:hypothetical protein EJB05_04633, partial [Eragrostis curvula]